MSTVPLPWTSPPLTKNDTRRHGNHHAMRTKWATALEQACWAIRAAQPGTYPDGARVILHWLQPDRRRRDPDGAALTLSACLDALVAEGVLPDDSWRFVHLCGIEPHAPVKGEAGRLWLALETVA